MLASAIYFIAFECRKVLNLLLLNNIFPNPLSTDSKISFELKKDQWVIINLYDLSGRLVNNIIDEKEVITQKTIVDVEMPNSQNFIWAYPKKD